MSVSLFNALPAGAVEVLTDATGAPHFKRADLGRYLGIVDIRATYRDVKTTSRNLLIPHASDACLSKDKNDQDAFVDLEVFKFRGFAEPKKLAECKHHINELVK